MSGISGGGGSAAEPPKGHGVAYDAVLRELKQTLVIEPTQVENKLLRGNPSFTLAAYQSGNFMYGKYNLTELTEEERKEIIEKHVVFFSRIQTLAEGKKITVINLDGRDDERLEYKETKAKYEMRIQKAAAGGEDVEAPQGELREFERTFPFNRQSKEAHSRSALEKRALYQALGTYPHHYYYLPLRDVWKSRNPEGNEVDVKVASDFLCTVAKTFTSSDFVLIHCASSLGRTSGAIQVMLACVSNGETEETVLHKVWTMYRNGHAEAREAGRPANAVAAAKRNAGATTIVVPPRVEWKEMGTFGSPEKEKFFALLNTDPGEDPYEVWTRELLASKTPRTTDHAV